MSESIHRSVMVREVLESLRAADGGEFLDCTFGGGGHSRAILQANTNNRVTAIDRDLRAIDRSKKDGASFGDRLSVVHSAFSGVDSILFGSKFDGVLADLGVSTDQIKEGRGFSFSDDDSLDMRMNEAGGVKASEIVNEVSESELVNILYAGGARNGREAARAIVRARPIASAKALALVVSKLPTGKKKINPATVIFQAIRMAVNNELEEIKNLMSVVPSMVRSGGRLSVITFHSIEDKAVTHTMRSWEGASGEPALWPGSKTTKILGKVLTRKAVVPSDEEVEGNPSSRSAKLRVFEFC